MKKFYFLILMFLFVCIKNQGFCSQQCKKTQGIAQQISLLRYEIEAMASGASKDNVQRLNIWLDALEAKLLSTLKHAEASLEKHRNKLNETDEADASSKSLEKIHSAEERVEACQELLSTLEQLKTKLMNKP